MNDTTITGAPPRAGHNSGVVDGARLRSFVERIERLEAEKAELAEDIREVLKEAKGEGFERKLLRKLVAERRLSPQERAEQEQLLDTYRHALGMYASTPLGKAALRFAEAVRDGSVAIEARK